ncbi:unnamed protein product [Microthlaspi erraticum]|uniref:F-box domain-containing protein n=1 Tax=Microthlaspi erraticum TaxID=1685480 RepID=A0A6D2J1T3_9BRAS|nr:unnamed protein product [Microthlaspi erraticum]
MPEPETEKKTSSVTLDCSLLEDCVSKQTETEEQTILSMADWSLLPEDLLHIISTHLENCFDVVHVRSVCSSWRSTIPFPCSLLSSSYSIPTFNKDSLENKGFCTFEKIPLFLFRVRTPSAAAAEYFLGGIGQGPRDESEDQTELSSPIQCSVKLKIPRSDQTFVNMLDCQILSLGYQYTMIGVVFLPLEKEEFVMLLKHYEALWVLKSAEMKWKLLENVPKKSCWKVVAFRGKFYASYEGKVVVIDPYSLDVTLLIPLQPLEPLQYLVPCGSDEVFLVEKCMRSFILRVSRLDEEAGKWVEVTDLGDRVLFIRDLGNVCCSAKELPDGCGVSGNSILFTNLLGNVTNFYKYGVREEDGLKCWRLFRDQSVTVLGRYPVVAFRVDQASP